LGPLIGAAFGLVFVLVNTGSVPTAIGVLLRVVAVAAFLAVLVTVGRSRASASDLSMTVRVPGGGFGRGYWLVGAGEVAAAVVGLVVLNTVLHAPQAAVAWISAVSVMWSRRAKRLKQLGETPLLLFQPPVTL
jgi:hypothetical protein